ncbi:Z1 domain-containing protein [Spirosoma oryzae]|uniref:Z1 domain-containing protein n=1 Tax=Spirosoma oryzae TaxID=1469603 RepID=A0A2T0RNN3_9BACT|nr:Z1 domain-containing protein [Spirosoma oryzae]PRY22732.1 Z1 domain-containing protein [Spirosoma oryzae]
MTHFNEVKSTVRELFYLFRKVHPDYLTAITEAVNAVLSKSMSVENILRGERLFSSIEELRQLLIKELEEEVNLIVEPGEHHALVDDKGHIDWYKEKRAANKIDLSFWNRYQKYLTHIKGWADATVNSIDTITDEIIEYLEDPTVADRLFDRRGLVVGYVQSGKTANFMGVINKAIDTKYRVIIVLAGIHNNLRSQTQMRIDEEVIGRDTSETALRRIGVTTLPNAQYYPVTTFTTQEDKGDFNKRFAKQIGGIQPNDNQPMLLIVKKNKSVLDKLGKYFQECLETLDDKYRYKDTNGKKFINNLPLLIIDDEADQASVNTRPISSGDKESDPTAINKEIRKLLNLFRQKAYLGYTATPFANIFIPHTINHSVFGLDLFPSSFILALDAPSNYFGPRRIFGLTDNSEAGLPIYRAVRDAGGKNTSLPVGHKATDTPTGLPVSMKEAIRAFLIASAIRRLRGQGQQHNTMLIHCTRYNNVQKALGTLVGEELNKLRNNVSNDDAAVLEELKSLWHRDFSSTSRRMQYPVHSWQDIVPHIKPAMIKMEASPLIINGEIGDILGYKQREATGLSVIAIGGDKLSRGLTLEGLTISYFTRSTSLYDTLMQMGRWFGYRLGFEDVCRIYTPPDLYSWYRHIATAFESLREEFIEMKRQRLTPHDFGLRVMSHPDMMITNSMKMRYAEEVKLTYRGTLTETSTFPNDDQILSANYDLTERFIRELGSANRDELDHIVWCDVNVDKVLDFMDSYQTYKGSPQANARRIAQYVRRQRDKIAPELRLWNVSLVTLNKKDRTDGIPFAGHFVRPYTRTVKEDPKNSLFIKRLVDPKDELRDFSEADRERFKSESVSNRQTRSQGIRRTHPLLSVYLTVIEDKEFGSVIDYTRNPIGFSISWPDSHTLDEIRYNINTVAQELDINEDEN